MALTPVNSSSTAPLSSAPEPARKAPAQAASAPKADGVSFSAAASALASTPDLDSASSASKVEQMRARIADGSYQPDSKAIASKMLEEAMLASR
jgi:negative regulator of flagellin synthesis FlgM